MRRRPVVDLDEIGPRGDVLGIPAGQVVEPDMAAEAVVFHASDEERVISGLRRLRTRRKCGEQHGQKPWNQVREDASSEVTRLLQNGTFREGSSPAGSWTLTWMTRPWPRRKSVARVPGLPLPRRQRRKPPDEPQTTDGYAPRTAASDESTPTPERGPLGRAGGRDLGHAAEAKADPDARVVEPAGTVPDRRSETRPDLRFRHPEHDARHPVLGTDRRSGRRDGEE